MLCMLLDAEKFSGSQQRLVHHLYEVRKSPRPPLDHILRMLYFLSFRASRIRLSVIGLDGSLFVSRRFFLDDQLLCVPVDVCPELRCLDDGL